MQALCFCVSVWLRSLAPRDEGQRPPDWREDDLPPTLGAKKEEDKDGRCAAQGIKVTFSSLAGDEKKHLATARLAEHTWTP